MSGQQNAEAGPSTALFLPPKGPPQRQSHLASTHDLLARFHLLPAYDKYVRPPPDDAQEPPDNGKGKAREQNLSPAPQTPAGEVDPDDDDPTAKGEKKKKNSYKHLIKGVPGKHSMKKDDYLAGIMQVPPKQRIPIAPFDLKTQREAFSVSLEGLKGWNPGALVAESAQAREDRKKRKELKRLAKAQAQMHAQAAASPAPGATPGTPRSGSGVGTPRPGVGTPRPAGVGTPRPTGAGTPQPQPRPGRPSLPPVVVPGRVGTPQRATGTPTSARTPHPHPLSAHPMSAGGERGVKREREREDGFGNALGNGGMQNGAAMQNGYAAPVPVIAAAKAGIPGARPRPVKKQRVVRRERLGLLILF
ncbi:hypothetical protein B0H17DRAFT_1033464 [Mycena rosella]|uniref:Mediator of RNA polymerase II transcription subunit 19 n=1 Tax=Mycena rosella TaxID=1033263 RepID=A0AAD7MA81_MYCRO|nr:hypothetical protein B0H17DRAFT_1033464 [Mycena rosella]